MRKIVYTLILLFSLNNIYSQSNIFNRGATASRTDTFVNYQVKDFIRDAEQNGANTKQYLESYFLFNNWKNNCSIQVSGKKILLNSINLNLQTNQFMYKTHKDSIFTIPSNIIDHININFNEYQFKSYKGLNKFVQVLLNDSEGVSLYKGYEIKILPKSDISVMIDKPYDRTRKETKYYLFRGSQLSDLKMRKKEILSFMKKDKQNKVSKFAKQHKLSFKKEKDVLKILNFYNSL